MGETEGRADAGPDSLGLNAAPLTLERGEEGSGPSLEVFVQVQDERQFGPLVMGSVIYILVLPIHPALRPCTVYVRPVHVP